MTMLEAGSLAAITVGGLLLAVNQAGQVRERAKRKRLANRTPSDIEKQIREWAWKHDFSTKPLEAKPNEDFRILTHRDSGVKVEIVKQKDRNWLYFAATVRVNEKHQHVLTPVARHDLTIELFHLGVEFEILAGDRIAVQHTEAFTEFSDELSFLAAFASVDRGAKMVIAFIQRLNALENASLPLQPAANTEAPPSPGGPP
jgi:hypothetical protein